MSDPFATYDIYICSLRRIYRGNDTKEHVDSKERMLIHLYYLPTLPFVIESVSRVASASLETRACESLSPRWTSVHQRFAVPSRRRAAAVSCTTLFKTSVDKRYATAHSNETDETRGDAIAEILDRWIEESDDLSAGIGKNDHDST